MKKILTIVWLTVGSVVGLFAQDGTFDATFTSGTGASPLIATTALQSDGKILIGGTFTSYNGTAAERIARLNTNGTIDGSFNTSPGANIGAVLAIAVQADGKVLIGGSFTSYNGTARSKIARLNTDGSLDATFDPGIGADLSVRAIILQADGKIIIGGDFADYNGSISNRLARLNTDGTLDATFDPGTGPNSATRTLALQADGKVLVGGTFTDYNGTSRANIARINADGTLDATFDPGTGANGSVRTLFLQADGKVMIGGDFTTYNGTSRNHIARTNADGSLDTSFDPGTGANAGLGSILVQSDGKIIIGGSLTDYNGTTRNFLARVNADGTLDTAFDPGTGADASVNSVAIQTDGQLVIGGSFTTYAGTPQVGIARVNNTVFSPLPVTWVNVTAVRQSSGQVRVQWKTSSETNNSRFVVQRSLDGKHFEAIGQVAGQGTTDIIQSYSFTDAQALDKKCYYRLQQVDFNGTTAYSKLVYVSGVSASSLVKLYPNPSVDQLNISFEQAYSHVLVSVISLTGVLVQQEKYTDTQQMSMNVSALPAGSYVLKLTTPSGQQAHRFVKQ